MLGYLSTARSKQFSYSETQRKVLALAYFTPNSGYCVYNLSNTFFFKSIQYKMFKIPYPIKEMLTFLGDHNYKKQFYFFSESTPKLSINLKPLLMEDNWCIRCQDWKLEKITAGISPVIIKKNIFACAQLFKMHHMTEYPPTKTGDIQGYTPCHTPQF